MLFVVSARFLHTKDATLILFKSNLIIQVCTTEDACRYARVSELFVYEKFSRVPAETVEAGDICAVCGIDDIQVRSSVDFHGLTIISAWI